MLDDFLDDWTGMDAREADWLREQLRVTAEAALGAALVFALLFLGCALV